MKKMSFVQRCRDFFGKRPDQTLSEFVAEMKDLTYEDKLEFHAEFEAMGLPTEPPVER